MSDVIILKDVTKSYLKHKALDLVNLSFSTKGIVGVIGPNGSGKSTLLKLMAGLLQPSSGEVRVLGEKVTRQTVRNIAFLSEAESLYTFQTVQQAVELWEGTMSGFSQETAREMLKTLNIEGNQKIKTLSKGNKARLKLVLTLSRKVPVLIMDEPFSGLDPLVREDILHLIMTSIDVENQILILSTHEVAETEVFLDHVIFLKEGRVVLNKGVESLREEEGKSVIEAMREVFL